MRILFFQYDYKKNNYLIKHSELVEGTLPSNAEIDHENLINIK